MQRIRKNKGITLVALVVTIIILLILTGIVVASLNGNRGIFGKAILSKRKYQNSTNEEDEKLSTYENEIDIASSRENSSIKYETVFEGVANEKGKIYELEKSINDYDMLIVYSNSDGYENTSTAIDKSAYCIGKNEEIHMNFAHAFDSFYYYIYYYFPTETSICIYNAGNRGWSAGQIYLIKGIKF